MAEAANTSLDMEGFQTGSGFDPEGPPDEGGRDKEIETMEIRSSAFNEVDFAERGIHFALLTTRCWGRRIWSYGTGPSGPPVG